MYENSYPAKRYQQTLSFLKEVVPPPAELLDIGVRNPFAEIMEQEGYRVDNTAGEDLDVDLSGVSSHPARIVTAFEILEHLVAPYNLLRELKAEKLVASVPLRLWFASAYRSKTDPWDRHFHEFEDWQFDWLLEKAGWKIKKRHQWAHPVNKIGFRPLLRKFTPRYYIVYAERE